MAVRRPSTPSAVRCWCWGSPRPLHVYRCGSPRPTCRAVRCWCFGSQRLLGAVLRCRWTRSCAENDHRCAAQPQQMGTRGGVGRSGPETVRGFPRCQAGLTWTRGAGQQLALPRRGARVAGPRPVPLHQPRTSRRPALSPPGADRRCCRHQQSQACHSRQEPGMPRSAAVGSSGHPPRSHGPFRRSTLRY